MRLLLLVLLLLPGCVVGSEREVTIGADGEIRMVERDPGLLSVLLELVSFVGEVDSALNDEAETEVDPELALALQLLDGICADGDR